jgi:hypothetical protein
VPANGSVPAMAAVVKIVPIMPATEIKFFFISLFLQIKLIQSGFDLQIHDINLLFL